MRRRTKKTSITEIAPWFKKEKYQKVPSLNKSQWYEQLLIRKLLKIFFEQPDLASIKVKKAIHHLRNNPIINIKDDESFAFFKPYFNVQDPCHKEGVYPLTLQELLKIENSIPKEKIDSARRWVSGNHLFSNFSNDPIAKHINQPIAKLSKKIGIPIDVIVINHDLPLRILVNQFAAYVKKQKKHLKTKDKSRIKTLDTYDWHRLGVLPYLDLKMWEQESGEKIKQEELLDAITPSGECNDINSLRTTRSLAKRLLSHSFLEKLATLAALEKPLL